MFSLSKWINELVDRTNPKRTHSAVSLIACIVLSASILFLVGCIPWVDKNLSPELFTLVSGLTGLTGYQLYQSKKNIKDNNTDNVDTK